MMNHEDSERIFHELCGLVLDAALTTRAGPELSIYIRSIQKRVHKVMQEIEQSYKAKYEPEKTPKPPANGKPAQPSVKGPQQ